MQNRSWLHVPGDDEDALGRAMAIGADVIVADLAEGIAPHARKAARALTAEWLAVHRHQITGRPLGRWVRVNPIDTGLWREDVAAVMHGAPDGFILPRSAGPESVLALATEIYTQEQTHQIASGSTRIIPMVGGTAQAALTVPAYVDASLPRLAGLCWDPAELARSLGATQTRGEDNGWTEPFRFLRGQVLLAAHARGIMAIDTCHSDRADPEGLRAAARIARADGFTGMLAIDPAQIQTIHAAFAPRGADDVAVVENRAQEKPALQARPTKRMLDLGAPTTEPTALGSILRSA
jgi:citrate lyase subunit beta/citryl-CoA lyase